MELLNQIIQKHSTMKKIFINLVLTFLFFSSFAQNSSGELDLIQKFIEVNVQIPFQARLADTQGIVAVRITMGSDNLPKKYEIVQNLTDDCDAEALRVIKLIHPKYLLDRLGAKKVMILQVPFINEYPLLFEKGYFIEYFDRAKKPYWGNEPAFARRYLVDTLTGIIIGKAECFKFEGKNLTLVDVAPLKIDSTERYSPELFEKATDTLKIYKRNALSNVSFPTINQAIYQNGRIAYRTFNERSYAYYVNGSIATYSKKVEEENNKVTETMKWFANGLLASMSIRTENEKGLTERFIAVWDTLGNQLVKNGIGNCQFYEKDGNDLFIHAGLIQDGFKEGKWIGNRRGEVVYEENYEKGKCIKGFSFANGQTFEYADPQINAEFIGGIPSFAKHIQKNLKYPAPAQRANVQGKVYVQFTVCTDGTLCDYNVLKSVGFGCDEEAIRVIQLSSGKWAPGKLRGKIIKTKFVLPINYLIAN